jgi:hypothetical protein
MVHRWKDEPAFQATIVEIRTQKNDPLQATDAQSTGKGSAGAEAEELLRNALATGPVAMKDIQAEAKEAGLSWATVRRAKDRRKYQSVRRSISSNCNAVRTIIVETASRFARDLMVQEVGHAKLREGSLWRAASAMIRSRRLGAEGPAVKTSPPLADWASAAISRSISAGSRRLIGVTSTPSAGTTDWITANCPIP